MNDLNNFFKKCEVDIVDNLTISSINRIAEQRMEQSRKLNPNKTDAEIILDMIHRRLGKK